MIVRENIKFKRGQESKKALDVGEYRTENQTIRRYLEPTPLFFRKDVFEWLSMCPPLMKELGVETEEDIDDLVTMETESTLEQNEELTSEDLEEDFTATAPKQHFHSNKQGEGGWFYQLGELEDGSKIIHWETGLTDGFTARKEWLK